jgi:hypothetical protein
MSLFTVKFRLGLDSGSINCLEFAGNGGTVGSCGDMPSREDQKTDVFRLRDLIMIRR